MAIQQTYSMIKPDGVRNGHIGEIINRFERAGLTIERMELGMVTPEQAKANYAEHEGKPFYDGLIAYITSGPVVKMVVSGEGAVAKCRSLMGATNPAEAAPGTIRGDFGLIMDENVIHGSDSPESAEREIGDLLCLNSLVDSVRPRCADGWRSGAFCVSVWFFWAIGLREGVGRRKSRYYGRRRNRCANRCARRT